MKTKFIFSIVLLFSFCINSFAQVGVGTSNPEGALDISSSTNGVVIPRVTLTALGTYAPVVNPSTGLAPVIGTLVWNDGVTLSPAGFYYWNGTAWTALGGVSGGTKWDLAGNVVGAAGTSFLGSTDNNPVRFRSNNLDRFEINQDGSMRSFGDGTAALPAYSWNSNTNMGLFRHPAAIPNAMGIATNGNERLRFIGTPQIQGVASGANVGTATIPFYSFYNNAGAGMWSPAAGKLAFSTNASEKLRIDNTGYVGIGTTFATTAPEAMLDIRSTNKGILIPRVALTSTTSATPVLLIKDSELVYNTATAGTAPNDVTPGFYYWTIAPAKWNKVGGSVDVKSGPSNATATLVEPNAGIPGPIGALITAGSDTTSQTFDATTITRTFNVTGFTGNTAVVNLNLKFDQDWMSDVDAYLTSPTGQIIELTTDNGGFSPGTIQSFNVTFSDSGVSNITTFVSGSVSGTYRPEGSLIAGTLTPNITTMSGFSGFNPNGTWTLTLIDDAGGNSVIYFSSTLEIATYGASNYRLVGETSMTYKAATNIIVNSVYSANPIDDAGIITALTRSTASAGAVGTTIAALPGTVLSYASDSPKQGTGNFWATTNNQSVSNGLTSGTTYYFQLWTKANVQTPLTANEIFSIIPMMIPQ